MRVGTLSRKQREIAEREELILDVATRLLAEGGFHHLSMERVAEVIEYSKGTVYQHFSCKEDILAAVARRNVERRTAFFGRALTLEGTTRERMTAVGAAYDVLMKLYPDGCGAEALFHASHMREKASEACWAEIAAADAECDSIVGGLIQEAIEGEELPMRDANTLKALYFGLWAISWGSYQILETVRPDELLERGFEDPIGLLHGNQERLLDGFGWQPLSTEHDYDAVRQRAREELFAEELQRIAAR